MKWFALSGDYSFSGNNAVFHGGETPSPAQSPAPDGQLPLISKAGHAATNYSLTDGTIKFTVNFPIVDGPMGCSIILAREDEPKAGIRLIAGLVNRDTGIVDISQFLPSDTPQQGNQATGRWETRLAVGDASQLKPNENYTLELRLSGSRVHFTLNDVSLPAADLQPDIPRPLQVGLWCWSKHEIRVSNFEVVQKQPTAFIVMPFDSVFDDVYNDVIKRVCKDDYSIDPIRGDEMSGPGMVIKDITDQVNDAQLIIADISRHTSRAYENAVVHNPNVFFEVGYAFARNKPIILMAKKSDEHLPFDISGFRVLSYEDTIGGKRRVEEQLRKHLTAITGKQPKIETAEDKG